MKYKKETVQTHLAQYKKDILQISEDGIWINNKMKYPHILPMNMKLNNLIKKDYFIQLVKLVERQVDPKIKLHSGFRHLNSSQALAFNLFGPLIVEKKLNLLLDELNIKDCEPKAKFEYIDKKIPKEETNFDFYIEGKKFKIYFEVKYTEDKFGSSKADKRHLGKYDEIYKNELSKICDISSDDFFKGYQLWRNIYYSHKGFVVFVFPSFRDDLTSEVKNAVSKISKQDKVKILFIDDLVNALIKYGNESMKEHYYEFRNKYLNIKNL